MCFINTKTSLHLKIKDSLPYEFRTLWFFTLNIVDIGNKLFINIVILNLILEEVIFNFFSITVEQTKV